MITESLGLLLLLAQYPAGRIALLYAGLGRYARRQKESLPRAPGEYRFLSVVVAARDEEEHLPACLDALEALDYPRDAHEVILVNDGSRDKTGEIMKQRLSRQSHWQYVESEPAAGFAGKVNALRCGVARAQGRYLVFTDADCRVPESWLQDYNTAFAAASVVCGHITQENPGGFLEHYSNAESLLSSLQVLAGCSLNRPEFSRGANWGYERKLLTAVGGYESLHGSSWGDDIFLLQRFRRLSVTFAFLPARAAVFTAPPLSWREYWRGSRRRYGKTPRQSPGAILRQILFLGSLLGVLTFPFWGASGGSLWWAAPGEIAFLAWIFQRRGGRLLGDNTPCYIYLALWLIPPWQCWFPGFSAAGAHFGRISEQRAGTLSAHHRNLEFHLVPVAPGIAYPGLDLSPFSPHRRCFPPAAPPRLDGGPVPAAA